VLKKVKIKYKKVETEISEYTCPHCQVSYTGAGIRRNVTRFLCDNCKKEIVVIR